jgi:hypothetical protein
MDMMPNEIEMDEWNELSPRQQDMVEHTVEVVEEFGQYNQGSGGDGAHYFDGSKNVFKAQNIMCGNCIFYNEDAGDCLVVAGNIDPEGLCKLWIIPEEEFTETPAQETEEEIMEDVTKRDFNAKEREHAAATGAAMPDGSYPINNRTDLENAIRSWGRGGAKPEVKAHIISRAKTLGAMDLIPDNWKSSTKSVWDGSFDPTIFAKGIL